MDVGLRRRQAAPSATRNLGGKDGTEALAPEVRGPGFSWDSPAELSL